MSRRRPSRRERHRRRSANAYVDWLFGNASPYINLNLSAPVLTLEEL